MPRVMPRKLPKDHVYEFGLSDGVPEAVREMDRTRAEADWQRRSDAAAAEVAVPRGKFRIVGNEEVGAWFVEEAQVVRSDRPYARSYFPFPLHYRLFEDEAERFELRRYGEAHDAELVKLLNEDRPSAKLEWVRIGRRRKGFFTYKRAAKWLREYLEPISTEPAYFTAEGEPYVWRLGEPSPPPQENGNG